jgi:hypothetical protein
MSEYRRLCRIVIILFFSSLLPFVVPGNSVAEKDTLYTEKSGEGNYQMLFIL